MSSAKKAVDKIIKDLCDRSGLGSEWETTDVEIRNEIRKEWIAIIELEFKKVAKP